MTTRLKTPASVRRRRAGTRASGPLRLLFAVLLFWLPAGVLPAAERLDAVLLNSDFGDPGNPKSAKIVLALPESLSDKVASARPDDFVVHVYPRSLSVAEGAAERYRAEGIYLWRFRSKIFLDVRSLPRQDATGPATVHIAYAPRGVPAAAGIAVGDASYSADAVDVLLAVDVSRSMMYNDPRKRRVLAARTFIELAREGGGIGRVGLVTFNTSAQVRSELVPLSHGEQLLAELNKVGADGMTSLDAPLQSAISMFSATASNRPVVVFLTDGHNEGSYYRNTHLRCAQAGIRIFSVGLSESADHRTLERMARDTGGIYFRSASDKELPEIYARIAAELGKRYLMHADILPSESGRIALPIDSDVRRIVAMADGGARMRVVDPEGRERSSGLVRDEVGGVYVGRPDPGEWRFEWSEASPGSAAFALFGDTSMFLDVFPPQLAGKQFAVGAVLAKGGEPFSGAEAWLEPVPGVFDERIRLYDDGRHADGAAGDGVYGALTDFPLDDVRRFDVVVRASGLNRAGEAYVRQTAGLALRTPEDAGTSPPGAALDNDLDFGVLFPGETGSARVRTVFNGMAPEDFLFELSWPDPRLGIPPLSADVSVNPGMNEFDIEITIPADAPADEYRGALSVFRDGGTLDKRPALVRVGEVRFSSPGVVDLGVIPPGTANFRRFSVPYYADKSVGLIVEADSADGLTANASGTALNAGEGELEIEATASCPIGAADGDMTGRIVLRAGPGVLDIPVRWSVRAYKSSPLPGTAEPVDVPKAPDLTVDAAPLELSRDDRFAAPLPYPGESPVEGRSVESPWERVSRATRGAILGDMPELSEPAFQPPAGAPGDSPTGGEYAKESGGDSLWNAWWLYLLAALLLLLLLLLLLCYILYRLGRSAMVRFLLASIIANLILMAIFIILLGTSESVEFAERETIEVTLVEDGVPDRVIMTSAESGLIAQSASSGASASESASAGGEAGGFAESAAPSADSVLPAERSLASAGAEAEAAKLATAIAAEASAASASGGAMSLRDRPRERRNRETATPELPEVKDPFQEAVPDESAADVFEGATERFAESVPAPARMELAEARPARNAVNDMERRGSAVDSQTARLDETGETAEMEFVELAQLPSSVETRDVRRRPALAPDLTPEPRVEIDDPARDMSKNAEPLPGVDSPDESAVAEARVDAAVRSASPAPATRPASLPEMPAAETARLAGGAAEARDAAGVSPAERFEDDNPSRSMSGRRDLRPGRRSGRSDGLTPGGRGMPAPEDDEGGGNESAAVGKDAGTGSADSGQEARFDAGMTPGGGNASGLLDAINRDGAPGGTGSDSPSRLNAPGGSGGLDRIARDGGGGSADSPARGGRNGSSRRNGSSHGDEPGGRPGDGLPSGPPGGAAAGPGSVSRPGGGEDAGDEPGGSGRTPGNGSSGERGNGSGDEGWRGWGPGGAGLNGEARLNGSSGLSGSGGTARPGIDLASGIQTADLSAARSDLNGLRPVEAAESGLRKNEPKNLRRGVIEATSSLDADSLLVVVGDFARMPDSAVENLFAVLTSRRIPRVTIEERKLNPDDPSLHDCLLALVAAEDASEWGEESLERIAGYLLDGGHIWVDAVKPGGADAVMKRLAAKVGGVFEAVPAGHQLSENAVLSGLFIGDRLSSVVTEWDWRRDWRYGAESNGRALRFLARTLNYFLSGNADQGIEIDDLETRNGLLVEAEPVDMPSTLRPDAVAAAPKVWQTFSPASVGEWRSAPWGDRLHLSSVSDGKGGRALKLDFDASEKGRMALYRAVNPPEDFSRVEAALVDVYYEGDGAAELSLVVTTPVDGAWVDHESARTTLAAGWNAVAIPVAGGEFRRLSGGGRERSVGLAGADSVGRFGFVVYRRGGTPGLMLMGDIRLDGE